MNIKRNNPKRGPALARHLSRKSSRQLLGKVSPPPGGSNSKSFPCMLLGGSSVWGSFSFIEVGDIEIVVKNKLCDYRYATDHCYCHQINRSIFPVESLLPTGMYLESTGVCAFLLLPDMEYLCSTWYLVPGTILLITSHA